MSGKAKRCQKHFYSHLFYHLVICYFFFFFNQVCLLLSWEFIPWWRRKWKPAFQAQEGTRIVSQACEMGEQRCHQDTWTRALRFRLWLNRSPQLLSCPMFPPGRQQQEGCTRRQHIPSWAMANSTCNWGIVSKKPSFAEPLLGGPPSPFEHETTDVTYWPPSSALPKDCKYWNFMTSWDFCLKVNKLKQAFILVLFSQVSRVLSIAFLRRPVLCRYAE